ncbi:MAG: hypothetical protein IJV50_07550 [Lachnospiraceae bacterium]|nr:hypothetical protein [Lachnospiraceae bacterium]
MLLKFLPETALRNAITAGWISIGNLWMFLGLLIMMKKAREREEIKKFFEMSNETADEFMETPV